MLQDCMAVVWTIASGIRAASIFGIYPPVDVGEPILRWRIRAEAITG